MSFHVMIGLFVALSCVLFLSYLMSYRKEEKRKEKENGSLESFREKMCNKSMPP